MGDDRVPVPTDGPLDEVATLRAQLEAERMARAAAEASAKRVMRRLLDAARRAELEHEDLRALMAASTHDIKNPLGAIRGFTSLLQAGALPEAQHAEVLDRIGRAASYSIELLDGLLEVLGAGLDSTDPEVVDLSEVARDVCADAVARHDGLEVRIGRLGQVWAPPLDVRRVLDNLVENAARYAGAEVVRISLEEVERDERWVTIQVADNGRGIGEHDRTRVFTIFKRGTDQPQGTGTGIGLSVSRRLVRSAGGDLWLEDQPGPEGGAAFSLRLPLPPG